MIYIAAVDSHWAIGQKGQLLVTIPQDQKRFRDMTLGKVIVMGRKTLDTLPGGQPLYGRRNVILSRDPEYRVKGADVCHSVEVDFAYSADAHFPNLEESGEWEMTEESDEQTYFDLCYTYRVYEKQRSGN